jgi:outer membrane protein TolC
MAQTRLGRIVRLSSRAMTALASATLLGGCVLAPRAAKVEEAALERAGEPYRPPFGQRSLPELPPQPSADDVLRRAFLANGDLEAAYYEWAVAVAKIRQAGGYPNTPLSLTFEQAFMGGTGFFQDTTVTAGPDPMESLAFPTKVYQAAKVATDDARAAGKRFIAKRLDLQRRVLTAWADYALLAQRTRIARENLSLLKLITDTATARVQAGAPQQDVLRAEIEYRTAEDEQRGLDAQLPQSRAALNAMLARDPESPLEPPDRPAAPRPLPADDAALLAMAAENNPELADLALQVKGRADAVELARQQLIPDFNPFTGLTGSASQFVGLGVSIPTFLPKVQGMIREARADLRRTEAMHRQATFDRAAAVVAALYALRNSERQAAVFERRILPTAERVVANARQSYAAGTGSFLELVESQRTLLQARLTLAEARAAREKSLAELEALAGVDLSSAGPHAPQTQRSSEATGIDETSGDPATTTTTTTTMVTTPGPEVPQDE